MVQLRFCGLALLCLLQVAAVLADDSYGRDRSYPHSKQEYKEVSKKYPPKEHTKKYAPTQEYPEEYYPAKEEYQPTEEYYAPKEEYYPPKEEYYPPKEHTKKQEYYPPKENNKCSCPPGPMGPQGNDLFPCMHRSHTLHTHAFPSSHACSCMIT